VIAEGTFVNCAELSDSGLRMKVLVVSLEGHSIQLQFLEGIGQLQKLGFCVNSCAVEGGIDPGMTNLCGAMMPVDVDEPG